MTTIGNREFFKGINKIEFEGKVKKDLLSQNKLNLYVKYDLKVFQLDVEVFL